MIGKAINSIISASYTKTFPVVAEQGTAPPYITYALMANDPEDEKDKCHSLEIKRARVTIHAKTYAEVVTIAAAIQALLDWYTGTVSGVVVDRIILVNEFDGFDFNGEMYERNQEYRCRVKY